MARQGLYSHDKDSEGLTRREREVHKLMWDGKSQLQVSEEMGISRQRVRQLVENAMRKGMTFPGNVKPAPPSRGK